MKLITLVGLIIGGAYRLDSRPVKWPPALLIPCSARRRR
jgi:hypothetical protein